jgi:hypothetical protein
MSDSSNSHWLANYITQEVVDVTRSYEIRAVELHDTFSIWTLEKIRKMVDFMVRNDMNTLIFHENNIVDKVVFPGSVYGAKPESINSYDIYKDIYKNIYDRSPSPFVFVDELVILRGLMQTIIEEATQVGIDVYLQTKELWFPELLYERKGLVKNGAICPSEPYWWEEFLPEKYGELIHNFPNLAGIVTSTGTRESRASLAHGKCRCEKCQSFNLNDWQRNIIMAIYKPLSQAGKKLVVRDFTYYSNEQQGIREGLRNLPEDIIVSIKNTPQDFYPTFPDNPLLGQVGNHDQWIEYEVMGEYFGFGVAPCILLTDIKARIQHGLEKGAKGYTARVDWEALPNHSCFDTVNLLNLYGIAQLSKNPDMSIRDIYYMWLTQERLIEENLNPGQLRKCLDWVVDVFEATWPIMAKTPYINGYLFSTNSKHPSCIGHADFLAREHHGMQKWFPDKFEAFTMTKSNVEKMLDEKDQAVAEIEELCQKVNAGNPGLKHEFYETLVGQFDIYRVYVKMFQLVGHSYVLIKYLQENGPNAELSTGKPLVATIQSTLTNLKAYEEYLKNYEIPVFKYPAELLISAERVHYFREDAERVFESLCR